MGRAECFKGTEIKMTCRIPGTRQGRLYIFTAYEEQPHRETKREKMCIDFYCTSVYDGLVHEKEY